MNMTTNKDWDKIANEQSIDGFVMLAGVQQKDSGWIGLIVTQDWDKGVKKREDKIALPEIFKTRAEATDAACEFTRKAAKEVGNGKEFDVKAGMEGFDETEAGSEALTIVD